MKGHFYSLMTAAMLAAVALATVSCGDSNGEEGGKTTKAAMTSLIGSQAKDYRQRVEVPAVNDLSMFIVHSTSQYGVTYTEEWDKEQKTQRWAAYSLTDNNAVSNWKRDGWKGTWWKGYYYAGDPFQEDSVIPAMYRTRLADYQGSGFTRGHIVNSQDRLMSKDANGQTYYLSNIQPQLYDFNAGIWLSMENWLHNLGFNKSMRKALYIAKGGTTTPTASVPTPFLTKSEAGGKINIPVPRYFWMAILRLDQNDQYEAIAFWAEHKKNLASNIKDYTISIDELEARTGIDFFPNLPDEIETRVEAERNLSLWRW